MKIGTPSRKQIAANRKKAKEIMADGKAWIAAETPAQRRAQKKEDR